MIRGKKGYDRLIYACKTVFTQPKTWLFCDKTIQSKSQAEHSQALCCFCANASKLPVQIPYSRSSPQLSPQHPICLEVSPSFSQVLKLAPKYLPKMIARPSNGLPQRVTNGYHLFAWVARVLSLKTV
jgi:hypothetical protein